MKKFFFALIIFGIFLIPASLPVVHAAPIVQCSGATCQACDLVKLGNSIINFVITISVIIATILLAYAGFLLVTAQGDTGKIKQARAMFTDIVIGIIIVLSGWLVVNTVMKLLVGDNLLGGGAWYEVKCVPQPEIKPPIITVPDTTPPGTPVILAPSGAVLTQAEAEALLAASGVRVVSSGNCTDATNRNCTSLEGITANTLNQTIAIANACSGCNLQITAGTEIGHTNTCHRSGQCVDINCAGGCSVQQINQSITAANQHGGRAVYEVKTEAERTALIARGVPASNVRAVSWITAPHMSLYTNTK